MLGSVLRLVGLLQVLLEEVVLRHYLLMAELRKVVQLSAERHQVDRTDIVRPKDVVHLVVSLRVHRKAMTVVGEVVRVLVVARTRLVGQVGGNGLNLTHELITDEGVVSVQIWEIGKSGKIG